MCNTGPKAFSFAFKNRYALDCLLLYALIELRSLIPQLVSHILTATDTGAPAKQSNDWWSRMLDTASGQSQNSSSSSTSSSASRGVPAAAQQQTVPSEAWQQALAAAAAAAAAYANNSFFVCSNSARILGILGCAAIALFVFVVVLVRLGTRSRTHARHFPGPGVQRVGLVWQTGRTKLEAGTINSREARARARTSCCAHSSSLLPIATR